MSRSTQYIGITNQAQKWIKKLTKNNRIIKIETNVVGMGIGYEDVYGAIYHIDKEDENYDIVSVLEEVEQCVHFSSGPMIYTHLKRHTITKEAYNKKWTLKQHLDKHNKNQDLDECYTFLFSWINVPYGIDEFGEYDQEKGWILS